MTAQRVLGTEAARRAALEMRQLLEGSMSAHIQALLTQGRTLSKPTVWDGPQAAAFRQAQWPSVERSLVLMQQRLPVLQANAATVVGDIVHSGTAGAIGVGSFAILATVAQDWRTARSLEPALEAALAAYNSGRLGIGVQGAANEGGLLALLKQRGSTGVDLNFIRPGNRGQNFPFVDAGSDAGFFSAKAHLTGDWRGAYARDLEDLTTGLWRKSPGQLSKAVNLLDANRGALQDAGGWPRDLPTNASAADIRAYLLDNAKLAVPDDQIAALSQYIRARALDFPENFGLPASPTAADLDRLLSRIVPSGIKSEPIGAIGDYFKGLDGATPTLARASTFVSRVMESPVGKVLKVGGTGLAVAGDVFTLASPSPDALGGPTTERVAAGLNLAAIGVGMAGPLLAANAATDWIPGVGEVTMGLTAAYFVGDLVWQNRQWIEDTGSHLLHAAGDAVSSAWHSVTSWL
jgi:hypothetical protein